MKKILFLNTQLAAYFFSCFEATVKMFEVEVLIIKYPLDSLTPFKMGPNPKITIIEKSESNLKSLFSIIDNFRPDIILCSGWSDTQYVKICKLYFNKIPTVLMFDNQWKGTWKQWMLSLAGSVTILKIFSHSWIPSYYQYEYARRIGFNRNNILFGMYCADTSRFSSIYQRRVATFKKYPHNFLFIGRLLELKGLIELCEVFYDITSGQNVDWSLNIVGSGPIKDKLKLSKNTCIRDFMQQSELSEVLENAGVFVFPSHIDAWGVVVHEAAAAGLPIISSDASGATPAFVRNAYNGYVHKTRDKLSIEKALLEIVNKTDDELFLMGARSNELSKQINHEIWANTLLSIEL